MLHERGLSCLCAFDTRMEQAKTLGIPEDREALKRWKPADGAMSFGRGLVKGRDKPAQGTVLDQCHYLGVQ